MASLSPSEQVPTGSKLMGHERGSTTVQGFAPSQPPAGASPTLTIPYSLRTCRSRAPVFPRTTVTAGTRVNNTSNHAVGGLGDYSVETGVNLEM